MKATISPKLFALVFAISFVLGICVEAAAPREDSDEATFTSIDFPDAISTNVLDINAAGEIVGYYVSAADGKNHGFLRSKKGEFTTIDFPGAVFTRSAGINPGGDIVGMYSLPGDPPNTRHGYLRRKGEFTTIDFPGAIFTNVLGINPRGDIVGRYCTVVPCVTGNRHGFLLSKSEFATIDVPSALGTNAWKINPRGQIVGGYQGTDGKSHVYLLSEGEFTTIDFPSAFDTANGGDNGGISPRGDIVSFYCAAAPCRFDNDSEHGFLLSDGEFTTIDFPGGHGPFAFGINARGDIVGGYTDTAGKLHGFLLSRREGPERRALVPSPPWGLSRLTVPVLIAPRARPYVETE
jgi:uncharacterized membrane protein